MKLNSCEILAFAFDFFDTSCLLNQINKINKLLLELKVLEDLGYVSFLYWSAVLSIGFNSGGRCPRFSLAVGSALPHLLYSCSSSWTFLAPTGRKWHFTKMDIIV